MINRTLIRALLVLFSVAIGQPTLGQWNQWGQPPPKRKAPVVNKYTLMSTQIPLPDIPPYTGKSKFQSGATIMAPAEGGGGMSYTERFFVQESLDEVDKWYAGALTGYGWKVTLATRSSVFANKDGATVNINFNGTHEPGWRSVIVINYTPRAN